MIYKTYKTWETMSPFTSNVLVDTSYKIFDNSTDATNLTNPIYSCNVLAGYRLNHLENILSQYVQPSYFGSFNTRELLYDTNCIKKFYIVSSIDNWGTSTQEAELTLLYDWSYSDNSNIILSNTSDNIIDPRQYFLFTIYDPSNDLGFQYEINGLFFWNFNTSSNSYSTGLYYLNILQQVSLQDGDILTVNSLDNSSLTRNYIIKETCKDYCLYYVNERGGWDYYLINGKETKKYNITDYSYKQNYERNIETISTNVVNNFGTRVYNKEYKESWELNTGWINEDKSQKVISLILSNTIYLHNLNTGEILPVIITNKNVDHKNNRNQNNRFIQYTINVENTQEKYRM